ncbi:MAG TPA: GNAT family N-acetyltransferase [Ktedonobacterales bacterium]|nr:GNAT family N-acetyltransferase [Ktedonobacterales bacterium]
MAANGGDAGNGAGGAGQGAIEVRPAREADREAVIAFCAHTWEDGDYIPYVWEEWLADTQGALLVATVDGEPVGLAHMRMLADDEAWLEGMRVAPHLRRHGIARRLQAPLLAAARERGAQVARLLTGATNYASQELSAGFGFIKVAEVLRYEADALEDAAAVEADLEAEQDTGAETGAAAGEEAGDAALDVAPGARLTIAGAEDFERIWDWLEHSALAPLNGGLAFGDWTARAMTEPLLHTALGEGRVWLLEDWGTIQALAVLEERASDEPGVRGHLHIRYMDGASEGIGRLALVLREEAGLRGLGSVVIWLPDLLILRDAMAGAGYNSSEGPLWVYAREL